MPITVVVGGQFGSEGKGKTTAYLCREHGFDVAVRCGGPNSGHTVTIKEELKTFEDIYDYVIQQVGIPDSVLYIDLSLKILKRRIFQRGRSYEMNADHEYFKQYNDKVKEYFKKEAKSKTYFFDVDDLDLDPDNRKLDQNRDKILEVMAYKR